jgi:hypothetical protein
MIKIAIPQIVVIRDNIPLTKNKFDKLAIKTIARKIKLTYQTCRYHLINFNSSSVNHESGFILFFTNNAKNITHAIDKSLASDEMMFCSVSIINN